MEVSHTQRVELADVPLRRVTCETTAVPNETPSIEIDVEPVDG